MMRRALILAIIASAAFSAHAQDVLQADPEHSKLIYEDAQVRVIRTELPPGATSPMHSHPERMVSIVNDARLRITTPDGKSSEVSIPAGSSEHLPPMTHSVTNIGTETFVEISTEMKPAATKENKPALSQSQHEAPVRQTNPIPSTENEPPAANVSEPPATGPGPVQRYEGGPTPKPTSNLERHPEVDVGGATLAYVEAGQGPSLVLVHDMLQDSREWQPIFDQLSLRFHVVAYSRRDHYPNRILDNGAHYTFEQHAKDLLELIRALGIAPVAVVGDRDGASVALLAAAHKPEAFRSMVVIEPVLEALLPPDQAFGARGARDEIYRMVHKTMVKKNPEDGLRTYFDWVRGSESWVSLPRERQDEFRDNAQSLRYETGNGAPVPFTCADAKQIKSPVLIVNGPATSPNMAAESAKLAECLSAAEKVNLPIGARFSPIPSDPQFVNAIEEFVLKQR